MQTSGMEQRISLITLGVSDLRRARQFYEAIGWTRAQQPDEVASHVRWKIGDGRRLLVMMLGGGCDGFGGGAGGLGVGVGVEQLAA